MTGSRFVMLCWWDHLFAYEYMIVIEWFIVRQQFQVSFPMGAEEMYSNDFNR